MVRWILVVVAVSGLFGSLQAQTNYCTTSYCAAGVPNVGCNPPPMTGGPACVGNNPLAIQFTTAQKTLILSEHNTRRSQLASGNRAPFGAAKRMPTLAWDDDLATQAGNKARSCLFSHDQCRNTASYAWAGQNLAISYFFGMNKTIETLIQEGIGGWWSEYVNTTQAQLDKYPKGYTGPAIGHFTQMVSDQTDKIGCAMQYWFLNKQFQTYFLVCDYSVTNIIERAVYKRGPVGSACTTGRNTAPLLTGLCSPAEPIDPVPNAS